MKQEKKGKIHFAWWVLLGLSIMIGLARGGINNAGGMFLTPVSKDLGIGMGSLTLYFSISSIATMIFLPIAGKMMAKYDIRALLIGAIILQAGSFAMFGFMNSVWGWYIFSIPMAIGSIFVAQMAGPVIINRWFKKHNGLALGIMMAAVGAFGAVIQPIVGDLIPTQGWRNTYIILGVTVIIIVIPIVLLTIRMKPEHKGLLPYGMEHGQNEESQTAAANKGVTFAVAKKSLAFYSLLLFFFFMTAIGSFAQHIAPYAMGIGYDIQFAGKVMGAFMIGMLVGALAFGALTDKIGAKNTAIFSMISGLVSIILLIMIPGNPVVFSFAIGIFGFVTSSIGTLGPLLTSAVFGTKEYSQIFATVAIGLALAGIVALPGYGFVYDITGSYTLVLYTIIIMLLINIVLVILAFKGKKKLENAGLWNE
ncbi:MFS transporter [Neobacillus mesonae]|uniref:MFS transporter n=1 Tax=Neobacillus mesonae TaxID=1193713 RepID=A0A3T0I4M7_9BACI|nr:MFS transporter [Neobacillus mesonae]AZU64290.1 MFS transporter [Neobacillus mesonae]